MMSHGERKRLWQDAKLSPKVSKSIVLKECFLCGDLERAKLWHGKGQLYIKLVKH